MISKVEAGKSYRLLDKKGYLKIDAENSRFYEDYFRDDVVTIEDSDFWSGYIQNDEVIALKEYKYFELVEEYTTPTKKYWDGKEPLEIGMVVTTWREANEYEVVYSYGKSHCVKALQKVDNESHIFTIEEHELRTCLPDPKEEFCKEILSTIRGTHPDFAQDTTWNIEEVAAICWNKLKGGADE